VRAGRPSVKSGPMAVFASKSGRVSDVQGAQAWYRGARARMIPWCRLGALEAECGMDAAMLGEQQKRDTQLLFFHVQTIEALYW
jgi:hypothetical protein